MGAWGHGILQNDAAQDGMAWLADRIESDLESFAANRSEEATAKAGAAVGMLLVFSPYSFNPENTFYEILTEALSNNQDHLARLPGRSAEILQAILDGQGLELAKRPNTIDPEVDRALYTQDNRGFIMQKNLSVCEVDLFLHPAAADYLQQIFDQMVQDVDDGFEDDECVWDLVGERYFLGWFSLLLVLPQGKVDPQKFVQWRDQFRAKWAEAHPPGSGSMEFEEKVIKHLELGFECGVRKYSLQG